MSRGARRGGTKVGTQGMSAENQVSTVTGDPVWWTGKVPHDAPRNKHPSTRVLPFSDGPSTKTQARAQANRAAKNSRCDELLRKFD